MNLGVVGVGQAGGKILDALLAYERQVRASFLPVTLAVNTAETDLLGLHRVPPRARLLVGGSRVRGNGVGANNELGNRVVAEDVAEVVDAVAAQPTELVDAFLVVAGLGGGTGSGGAPVLARELRRRYTEPVYGLGALPSRTEASVYQHNAARSLTSFLTATDSLLLLDNDAWGTPDGSLADSYAVLNEGIARRLGVLATAGEPVPGATPEMVVDATEVMNTLAAGGIATVGYATAPLSAAPQSWADRLLARRPPPADPSALAGQLTALVQTATLRTLSLSCDVASVERALLVVAGPPEYLSRKGVESAMAWLEATTGSVAVRGGDYPLPDEPRIGALVVLAGASTVPRVSELVAAVQPTTPARDAGDLPAGVDSQGG